MYIVAAPVLPQTGVPGGGAREKSGWKANKQVPGKLQVPEANSISYCSIDVKVVVLFQYTVVLFCHIFLTLSTQVLEYLDSIKVE